MSFPIPPLAIASLALAGALSAGVAGAADFRHGTAIEASQADRSITIGADTRWANVMHGESVRFVSGAKVFGWKFDGTRSSVDLSEVAPAGFVGRPLMVYIKREHRGRGGD